MERQGPSIRIYDARRADPPEVAALRCRSISEFPQEAEVIVSEILGAVRERGDAALVEYTRRFDCPGFTADQIAVSPEEIERAYTEVEGEWLAALRQAIASVRRFHEQHVPESWLEEHEGTRLGQRVRPLDSVGMHIPGFSAPLYSSIYMLAVPAAVAGVERLALATPPRKDGSVAATMLVAAAECGVREVYRVGGAQAVAAFAYGTQTVNRVDKVVGPGNVYVVLAKRAVFGLVGIDSLTGPSESLIIADESADPVLVAVDLLSQAEHTGDNAVFLLTTSMELANAVNAEMEQLLQETPRAELAAQSLSAHGAVVLVSDLEAALSLSNDIAPEHLQLMVAEPTVALNGVRHAGCIFVGPHSPVPLGDYAAGPSHVLPTNGTARFSSPVTVQDFVKVSSIVWASEKTLKELGPGVEILAEGEGLPGHAEAIRRRRG